MKIYSYLAISLFVCLSLIPPIDVIVKNPANPYWIWMILIAGFAGIFTLFVRTDWPVRVIAIGGFINCFLAAIPYISFTSYVSLVACCYFYIICTRIENWSLVFRGAQTVVLLDLLIMVMQWCHVDHLLNFANSEIIQFGTMGYHMWMASFGVVIGSLLLPYNDLNILFILFTAIFTNSPWTFVCFVTGSVIYLRTIDPKILTLLATILMFLFFVWGVHEHKFTANMDAHDGRVGVWEKTIHLSNQHPIKGWGIGSYKDVFFPLSRLNCMPWKEAHNFIFQLCFEIGYVATGCLLFGLGCLLMALYKAKLWSHLSAALMIFMDALVHFPDRMIQTVPLIIVFLAFCSVSLKKERPCPSYSRN